MRYRVRNEIFNFADYDSYAIYKTLRRRLQIRIRNYALVKVSIISSRAVLLEANKH